MVATLLLATPVLAQQGITETEFIGWTTRAFDGFLDSDVSGGRSADSLGSRYLVRHLHRKEDPLHDNLGNCCVQSVSLSQPLDPSLLGAEGPYEIAVDLRYQVDQGYFPGEVRLAWQPVVEQAGELFFLHRLNGPPTPELIVPLGGPYHREVLYLAEDWAGGHAPVLDAGGPPIRVGLFLFTTAFPSTAAQVEARVTVDNFMIMAGGEVPPLSVSFVDTYPPDPSSGTGLPQLFAVLAGPSPPEVALNALVGLNRPPPGETIVTLEVSRYVGETLFYGTTLSLFDERPSLARLIWAPASGPYVVSVGPSDDYQIGDPGSVEVPTTPCTVLIAGQPLPCDSDAVDCAHDVFFTLSKLGGLLSLSSSQIADPRDGRQNATTALVDSGAVLRGFRGARMATQPAGRYYRDLYEIMSPPLARALIPRASLVRRIADAQPPWITALDAATTGTGDQVPITQDMVDDMLGIFDTFEEAGDQRLQRIFRFERERLRLEELPGKSIEEAIDLVSERGGPPPCTDSATTLCLGNGRFLVEVFWKDFQGKTGDGRAIPLSDDSGAFWFSGPDNVELVVKVLDATTVNDRFWVFYGALSNVEYTLTVTDTVTGALRAYSNPAGKFASVGDTGAFTPDGNRPDGSRARRSAAHLLEVLGDATSDLVRRGFRRLRTSLFGDPNARLQRGLVASSLAASSSRAAIAQLRTQQPATEGKTARGACIPSGTALCLNDNRFRVEVTWRDFRGGSGSGRVRPLTADTGTFWFFDDANTELILKVLDGRSINDRFWVFYGALSNVGYTIEVTDTATGAIRRYENPPGEFASRGDVNAF